tara:strand:+ start:63 stop:830 length:768 start_codon:yes stop_codon:yes gene_type:complete
MTLKNKRILVTRPYEQAGYLSSLIKNHGGISVRFPTIEIQSLERTEELLKCFDRINEYDFIIFISQNAAKIAIKKFFNNTDLIKNVRLIAIGPSTAKVLSDSNFNNVIYPYSHSDSEALLDLKELQSEKIHNKKILIIRGVGGRELLVENLMTRGAIVNCVEIYKRIIPKYSEHEINKIWQKIPDAIVVTSNDVLSNLIVLLSNYKTGLLSIPLITMSNRITAHARKIGFNSEICIVDEKNDDGILRSLLEFFED